MVERQPVTDAAATVMADDREPLMPQIGHERHQLGGHLPLGVPLAERAARRGFRRAIAPQVWGDHAIALPQTGRDPVPAEVCLREAVQQEHRMSATALADEIARLSDTMTAVLKAGQRHAPLRSSVPRILGSAHAAVVPPQPADGPGSDRPRSRWPLRRQTAPDHRIGEHAHHAPPSVLTSS
jgi:hypothetical protein